MIVPTMPPHFAMVAADFRPRNATKVATQYTARTMMIV